MKYFQCLELTLNHWIIQGVNSFRMRQLVFMLKCTCTLKAAFTRRRQRSYYSNVDTKLSKRNLTFMFAILSPIDCDSDMENMAFCVLWNSDTILRKGCLFFRCVKHVFHLLLSKKTKQPITFAEIIIISVSEVFARGRPCLRFWEELMAWLHAHARMPLFSRGSTVLMEKHMHASV